MKINGQEQNIEKIPRKKLFLPLNSARQPIIANKVEYSAAMWAIINKYLFLIFDILSY